MRTIVLALPFMLACLGTGTATSIVAAQSPPACNPDTASRRYFLDWVTDYATAPATDSLTVAVRNGIGIPAVAASQVTVSTSATTCSKARNAYAKLPGVTKSATLLSVIVVKAGSIYVVSDPTQRTGEFGAAGTFDGQWRKISAFNY